MIKKLLSTVLFISSVGVMNSSAQALCTSNISCVPPDSTFGICPDSATGLPAGTISQAYTVTMSIKIPASTVVAGVTYNLTHLALTEVKVDTSTSGTAVWVDLSAIGLTYLGSGANAPSGCTSCSISGYTMTKFGYWNAPGQSCVIVSGTPNKVGTFPIKIISQARAVFFGQGTWAAAPENNDYRLVVAAPSGVGSIDQLKFEVSQNTPNPFSDKSEIRFSSVNSSEVEFKVYNLLGSVVYNSNFKSVKGVNTISIDANTLSPGVYMYSVKNGANTITKRMVVSNK
ncbi:MAG: T9SS type A sorting domain-containing protein [Bacteroidia bacterium]|nr:T9SS type A sorting domain-containing protein [Bacteroidia bacterium]